MLVTSEKAQALRVLRDKLPPGMQELCVSITDASAKGHSDLARSVATMAGHRTDFHPGRAERQIVDLTARREEIRRRRSELLEDIRALRESETYQHPQVAPGYAGTLASIARTLVETAEQNSWVTGHARGDPPVSVSELSELLMLLQQESPSRSARRGQRLPDALPFPVNGFAQLVLRIRAGDAVRSGRSGSLVTVLEQLPPESLLRLDPVCREVAEAVAQVRSHPALATWSFRATEMLLSGDGLHRWQRAIGQLPAVDVAERHDRDADFAVVDLATSVDPAGAASVYERFAAHLSDGSSIRRIFKSNEQKEVERFGRDVLVNGTVPVTAAAAAAAGHHLRFVELARRIDTAFQPVDMKLPSTTDRAPSLDAMHGIRRACASVERLVGAASALQQLLAVLPPHDRPTLMRVPELERVAAVALAVGQARSAAIAQAEIDAAGNALLASVPPAERAPEMIALIDALRALDPSTYESAVGGLAEAGRQQAEQRRCDDLRTHLRESSPAVADDIESRSADPVWATRLPRWPHAWARACAVSWIAEQTGPGREQVLDGQLAVAVSELHRLTGDLAAARAWKACLQRMNAEQVQALQSYRNSVARVGKGTGKFAERFRQSAREAMTVAQAAVPAWVMPIQQVLASVPPQPDSFDVVIVDEASQADLTSAFLLWLAPRVIVVGDDKQCTPSEVSSGALQPVFDRLDAELHDIPSYLRTAFTPKDSLFSLLRTRFGQVVRLREHFRCMPEIISWSSGMFYRDTPLVPLRQFGADRLPPLRHTHVAGAETEGSTGRVGNRAEALAIAESVRACLDDPAYERRTFGVVVLQSSQTQVDLINHELRQRISASEWEERRIRVGTAPDFQGDERHVVWLSLVAAPNSPRTALTRDTFRQSYNVAASRAQDQLWLFHSVTPDLLSQADLRHSLLTYMLSGGSPAIEPVLTDVDPDRRHDAFDSLFEQRVFLDLVARGYHVTPQVESNRRRIDLVVTGASGKLAVECDGEAFHTTPEQRGADLDREQELKRCGWTFERIRESIYYLDREKSLAPVWLALDRLGIGPLGSVMNGTWTPIPVVDQPTDGSAEPSLAPPGVEARPELGPIFSASMIQGLLGRDPLLEQAEFVSSEQAGGERSVEMRPSAGQDHRAAVLQASGDTRLTNESVRILLRITRDEALHVLQAMVAEGLLERRGVSGGTHYVAVAADAPTQGRHAASVPVVVPSPTPRRADAPSGFQQPYGQPHDDAQPGETPQVPADLVPTDSAVRPERAVPLVEPLPPAQAILPSGKDLGDREFLLQAAQRHPLTTTWVAEHLAIGMAEARALLQDMADGGLLRRTGQTKGTRYVLPDWTETERAPETPGERARRFVISPQQRAWVQRAAQNRQLTNESVRGLLRISPGQAIEVLSALVEEGVLERRDRARGTYYVLAGRGSDPELPSEPASASAAPRAPALVKVPQQLDTSHATREPLAEDGAAPEFEREMRRLYERTLKETGYKAARFLSLVSEHGGVATAHQLLAAGSVSVGFTELWERRRLDLTVEAVVLKPRYAALFRESERDVARYRLSEHGHVIEGDDH